MPVMSSSYYPVPPLSTFYTNFVNYTTFIEGKNKMYYEYNIWLSCPNAKTEKFTQVKFKCSSVWAKKVLSNAKYFCYINKDRVKLKIAVDKPFRVKF